METEEITGKDQHAGRRPPTVQQLVDQHEVVLDVLFGNLSEVRLHDIDDFQQKLENHGSIYILLRDRS